MKNAEFRLSNGNLDTKGFATKAMMLLVQSGVLTREEVEKAMENSVEGMADLIDKRSLEIAIENDSQS